MTKEFHFLQVIHFHQPVGNFDSVIERATRRCYEPFLDTIAGFPEIRFNLHYSGCLLEWFKKNNPALILKIKRLIKSGQVEILGGGFYEPIFSSLSLQDGIEQIKMLSDFIKEEFGVRAKGAWLPERVWEPHLAEVFQKAGIIYTIVDDTHLRYAGLKQGELYGYYVTEDKARCLNIFASDKFLRYAIPFEEQKVSLDYFNKIMHRYSRDSVLYGDDGEKFGEWPGTEDWVYAKGWFRSFLKLLTENSSWLRTEKISEYMRSHTASGRVYLPTASYQEMSEWALPSDSAEAFKAILEEFEEKKVLDRYIDFIRGGFWRNFLVKYPESNQMHKRMLLVSERLRRLQGLGSRLQGKRPDAGAASRPRMAAKKIQDAQKELFRGQCNCAYWHGVFGGLYLYHLRRAIYEHIISADRILDEIEDGKGSWVHIEDRDFDCDGQNELIVNTPKDFFSIDPAESATVTEWDIKDRSLNIVNTIARRKEAYHSKLKELADFDINKATPATIHEPRLDQKDISKKILYYDDGRRVLFRDRFLPEKLDLARIIGNLYNDKGDFSASAYSASRAGSRKIRLEKRGMVDGSPVKVVKAFSFYPDRSRIRAGYEITNLSREAILLNFATELNFSLTKDSINTELNNTDTLILNDEISSLKIKLKFSEKADKVFRYCVNTISLSERGAEENYQATCLLPVFRFKLKKNESKSLLIEISTHK